jgi:peptidoglycan/LPS O-acetylase OafA/YrhL
MPFKHRPELDGVRGIAILAVLASHAGVPGVSPVGGLAGVTLFFALSGYLITGLLLAELDAAGAVNLGRFYLRRALRLFPALAAVLVVVALGTVAGAWASLPGSSDMPVIMPAVILYISNWVLVGGQALGVLGHTWSLGIEEQFYLLWPAVLLIALRLTDRRRLALVAVGFAALITPYRVEVFWSGDLLHGLWGSDVHADALLIGCAVALMNARLGPALGWLGVVGVVVSTLLWPSFEATAYMTPIATVAAALAVAGAPDALRWAPLAYVGRISYGLYLWHYLFLWWGLPWLVVIVLSFVTAQISYVAIERPFVRLKDRLRVSARPAASAASAADMPPPLL